MFSSKLKLSVLSATVVMAASASFNTADATNGYFNNGYGASSKGVAGAGVALNLDALSAATNPASMVHVGNRMDGELGFFMPDRKVDGDGTVNGTFESINKLFLIPQFGVNVMLDENSSIGFTMSGNGGMNTEYETNPFSGFGAGATTGIEATNAPAGVDLAQALMGVTYSRKMGNQSFGITPTLAAQRFKAYGLQGFEGISSSPYRVHGNGYDYSVGYGLRAGYQAKVTDQLTLGAAAASKMYMTRFQKYEGLFAEDGDFDIPANLTLGAAYKVPNSDVTVAFDWQYIMYGDVKSIANTGKDNFNQACVGERQLGRADGCGFGWDDQHVFKLGVQYSGIENLVLRAGASHNTQVYRDEESLFNILAPAVVRTHLSVGGTYSFSPAHSVNLSYTRSLSESQTGGHPNQQAGKTTTHTMDQHDVVVGYAYKW